MILYNYAPDPLILQEIHIQHYYMKPLAKFKVAFIEDITNKRKRKVNTRYFM